AISAVLNKFLNKLRARGFVLDKNICWSKTLCLFAYRPFQVRIVQAFADHMQQINSLVLDAPGGAHTEVAELSTLVRCVPALKNQIEFRRFLPGLIEPKPLLLDHSPA